MAIKKSLKTFSLTVLAVLFATHTGLSNQRVIEKHLPSDISEVMTVDGIMSWVDYAFIQLLGFPLRSPGMEYKSKHEDMMRIHEIGKNPIVSVANHFGLGSSRPKVQSLET